MKKYIVTMLVYINAENAKEAESKVIELFMDTYSEDIENAGIVEIKEEE